MMWTRVIFASIFFFGFGWAAPQSRVVNGTDSDIHKFPFMVSLRYNVAIGCGGTILTPKWILTAGHCVEDLVVANLTVQYGVTNVNINGPNVMNVTRYIIHEDYNNETLANDVALLELSEKLVYNYKTVAPVKLAKKNFEIQQIPEGEPGILIGWGRNETEGPGMVVLQEVNLKIYSDAECAERHGDAVTSDNICAGVDEGWKGQCNGDSGGPLLYHSRIQVGIVSWSIKPCGVPPYPGVYTKVSHYVDWIKKHVDH